LFATRAPWRLRVGVCGPEKGSRAGGTDGKVGPLTPLDRVQSPCYINIIHTTKIATEGNAVSPTDKPILNFVIDPDLLKRVDDFRYEKRFPTRAAAVKWLLEWALEQKPEPDNA
jgi:hypothetical protein